VITPSGKVITLQGYEPQAYKILLETYTEEEILNSRIDVPEIWWFDDKDKRHRYFVDFYVPKNNIIIEVKSKRTYLLGKDKIEKTLQASIEAGYNIELWIMDEKGNILEKIVKQVNTTIKNGNSKEI
jgi:predicted AAA+ superfamily ATPase